MRSVAVVGGGITGLTAAFRLWERGIPVAVYEAGERVGGPIQTIRDDGYLAEFGPNTILETSPKVTTLVRDLGLESRRRDTDPRANKNYIVRGGKPIAVPVSELGFLRTPLFSTRAKLRLLAEPFVRRAAREESLAEFVVRRLGREFLDYAINPFVAGIYAGDPEKLSVRHAFPKIYALEKKYGSLILGKIFGARERRARAEKSAQTAAKFSFDEGLQVLIDALRDRLADSVRLRSPVSGVERAEVAGGTPAARCCWRVCTGGREGEHAAVLLTAPAHKLAGIEIDGKSSLAPLAQIPHPPVASVVLGFRREDVAHSLDGFGMLIPEVERFNILGTIFSSTLFGNRAPAGHVTLTSYIGGCRNPELALRDPAALVEITLGDLRRILGVSGAPRFRHVAVFPKAIPQYEVGFGRFKQLMSDIESKAPGLFFAGSFRDGIALGSSIASGDDAAARIASFVAADNPAEHRVGAAA
jgi:protoporphyrinogen/coproporphyrinogen III oxidase